MPDREVEETWQNQSQKNGFTCFVVEVAGKIMGASWFDMPSIEQLRKERGEELADFAVNQGSFDIIWLRETCVDPSYQQKGVAKALKEKVFTEVQERNKPYLLLTRMRDDNVAVVRVNSSHGLRKTGIRVASTLHPGIIHDYWYLNI